MDKPFDKNYSMALGIVRAVRRKLERSPGLAEAPFSDEGWAVVESALVSASSAGAPNLNDDCRRCGCWSRSTGCCQATVNAVVQQDQTAAVLDLMYAARRVWKKYGHDEAGVESDWTEWTDLRDALKALDGSAPSHVVPNAVGSLVRGEAGDWIDAVALDIVELGDRTREDDLLLVTAAELRRIILNNVPVAAAVSSTAERQDRIDDLEAVLHELVSLKNMKNAFEAIKPKSLDAPRNYRAEELEEQYRVRQPKAWQRAREVLGGVAINGARERYSALSATTPVEPKEYPYARAAFINAIADEGSKAEAIQWLQKTWNELMWVRRNLLPPRSPERTVDRRVCSCGAQKGQYHAAGCGYQGVFNG